MVGFKRLDVEQSVSREFMLDLPADLKGALYVHEDGQSRNENGQILDKETRNGIINDYYASVPEFVEARASHEHIQLSTGHAYEPASYHSKSVDPALKEQGQDRSINDQANGLFAVFDGVGGLPGGEKAAQIAKEAFAERLDQTEYPDVETAVQAMRDAFARACVRVRLGEGDTTAVVAKYVTVGDNNYMLYGNAGDSRLMRWRDDRLKSITTDQSDGNVLHNSLGYFSTGLANEYGIDEVRPGDKYLLCSDGVTGDWGNQRLTDDDFRAGFAANDPQVCAETFVRLSRKDDDTTAVVVAFGPHDETEQLVVTPAEDNTNEDEAESSKQGANRSVWVGEGGYLYVGDSENPDEAVACGHVNGPEYFKAHPLLADGKTSEHNAQDAEEPFDWFGVHKVANEADGAGEATEEIAAVAPEQQPEVEPEVEPQGRFARLRNKVRSATRRTVEYLGLVDSKYDDEPALSFVDDIGQRSTESDDADANQLFRTQVAEILGPVDALWDAREKYAAAAAQSARRSKRFGGAHSSARVGELAVTYNEAREAYYASQQSGFFAEDARRTFDAHEDEQLLEAFRDHQLIATGKYETNEDGDLVKKERKGLGKQLDKLYAWFGKESVDGKLFERGKVARLGAAALVGAGVAVGTAAIIATTAPVLAGAAGVTMAAGAGGALTGRVTKSLARLHLTKQAEAATTLFADTAQETLRAAKEAAPEALLTDHIEAFRRDQVRQNSKRLYYGVGAAAIGGTLGLAASEVNWSGVSARLASHVPRPGWLFFNDWDFHNPFNSGDTVTSDPGHSPESTNPTPGQANTGDVYGPYIPEDTEPPVQPEPKPRGVLHGFDRSSHIEQGSGYVREIQDMFAQNGYQLSLAEATELYEDTEDEFDGSYLRNTGSYVRSPGDYGIAAPGNDVFRRAVARRMVKLAVSRDMIELDAA